MVFLLGGDTVPTVLRWLIGALILGPICLVALWIPLSLTVDEEGITLRRVVGRMRIEAGDITDMRPLDRKELAGSLRTFGSGGFGGYFGRFWNKRLGHHTMYATELRNLLIVRTPWRSYVFNFPEDYLPAAKS